MKIQRTKWMDRKFNFDFPVSHFPFIIERLSGTYARLKEKTSTLSEKKLSYQPNGNWSIKEHIGHLVDLEELHESRIDDFKNRLKLLRAADMSNKKTKEASYNSRSTKELLLSFQKVRTGFLAELSEMDEQTASLVSMHPRLNKTMRLVDMIYFVAEHDDHHLVCINEILGIN